MPRTPKRERELFTTPSTSATHTKILLFVFQSAHAVFPFLSGARLWARITYMRALLVEPCFKT